jgi:hypothetical protein
MRPCFVPHNSPYVQYDGIVITKVIVSHRRGT